MLLKKFLTLESPLEIFRGLPRARNDQHKRYPLSFHDTATAAKACWI